MDFIQLSKTVSHALRHEPWLYELELDDEGWVDVSLLLSSLARDTAWEELTERDLTEMIHCSSKRRHELRDGRMRALYGHSLPGRLSRSPARPPRQLYHGTSPKAISLIRRDGLLPMDRQYVHLSVDCEMAIEVGRRKSSSPVVLVIRAGEAADAGVLFYAGNEKVWLADHIPPQFIEE